MRSIFATARTPRFRAVTRRGAHGAAVRAMALIALTSAAGLAWLLAVYPAGVETIALVNLVTGVAATLGWIVIETRRVNATAVAFAVLVVVDGAIVLLGVRDPGLTPISEGYLLMLPAIVALVSTWSTRWHLGWLGFHWAFALGFVAVSPLAGPGAHGPAGILGLLIVATSISVLGHVISLRARVAAFDRVEQARASERRARRDQDRLERANILLEQLARTDDLTGLPNRLALQLAIPGFRAELGRGAARYAVLMLDVDRFKTINDLLGHVRGDEVLAAIGVALRGTMREASSVFRFGGEEFAAVVPVATAEEGYAAAERARASIECLAIPHPGNPPYGVVTISVGVAILGPSDENADAADWFARADRALYAAKRSGRNRWISAEGQDPSTAVPVELERVRGTPRGPALARPG